MCMRVCAYMHTCSCATSFFHLCILLKHTRAFPRTDGHTARGAQTTHRLHKIHGHHLARRRRPFAAAGILLRGRSLSSALDLRILRFSDSPLRAGLAVSGEVCQERFNTYSSYRRAQPATLAPQPIAHSPVAQPPSGAHVNSPWRKVSSVFSSIRFTTHVSTWEHDLARVFVWFSDELRDSLPRAYVGVSVVRAHARTRIPLSVACDPAVSHARFRWRSVSVGSGTMRPADGRAV